MIFFLSIILETYKLLSNIYFNLWPSFISLLRFWDTVHHAILEEKFQLHIRHPKTAKYDGGGGVKTQEICTTLFIDEPLRGAHKRFSLKYWIHGSV